MKRVFAVAAILLLGLKPITVHAQPGRVRRKTHLPLSWLE